MVILDRVQKSGIVFRSSTAARLFGTCVLLAVKISDDKPVWNKDLQFILGRAATSDVLDMEMKVLDLLKWDLWIPTSTFVLYERAITTPMGLPQ